MDRTKVFGMLVVILALVLVGGAGITWSILYSMDNSIFLVFFAFLLVIGIVSAVRFYTAMKDGKH